MGTVIRHDGHTMFTGMVPACCNGLMHFNPYGGVAAQIAADLVNAGPAATAETITGVLKRHGYRPLDRVTTEQADALIDWADRLRPIFASTGLRERVKLVNELLGITTAKPYVSQHDGRAPHLHFADETAPPVDRIVAYTAAGLAHALCEEPARIGQCGRDGCDTVFVDTSRNGRRRFCSNRCANRVHVAAHRSRATPAAAS